MIGEGAVKVNRFEEITWTMSIIHLSSYKVPSSKVLSDFREKEVMTTRIKYAIISKLIFKFATKAYDE